jgi:hypothetical protein
VSSICLRKNRLHKNGRLSGRIVRHHERFRASKTVAGADCAVPAGAAAHPWPDQWSLATSSAGRFWYGEAKGGSRCSTMGIISPWVRGAGGGCVSLLLTHSPSRLQGVPLPSDRPANDSTEARVAVLKQLAACRQYGMWAGLADNVWSDAVCNSQRAPGEGSILTSWHMFEV